MRVIKIGRILTSTIEAVKLPRQAYQSFLARSKAYASDPYCPQHPDHRKSDSLGSAPSLEDVFWQADHIRHSSKLVALGYNCTTATHDTDICTRIQV